MSNITYPDKDLDYDGGRIERTYYTGDNGKWRVECSCGLCGAYGEDAKQACFNWNVIIASLVGPYSFVELTNRRIIRLLKENGQQTEYFEKLLQEHIEAYTRENHQ